MSTSYARRSDSQATCPDCATVFPLHGMHWCGEHCSQCLAGFRWTNGDDLIRESGFWDDAGKRQLRANIDKHGGRYVPHFNRTDPLACGTACAT